MTASRHVPRSPADFRQPHWAQFLLTDARAGWIWLVVRVFLAVQWLVSGFNKLGDPAWTGHSAGSGVRDFVNGTLQQVGSHRQVQGTYAWFLQNVVLPNAGFFGFLVTFAEIAVGLCLLAGAFTGIAAFVGLFLNANYLLAGAVGLDPLMILAEALLVLAWRNAGWVGLDRRLLPTLGTPWQPGSVFVRSTPTEVTMTDVYLTDPTRLPNANWRR